MDVCGTNSTVVDELLWFEIEKAALDMCSPALLIGGVGGGVDVFAFASFNTQEGGVALIEFVFTNRLGLSG